MIPALLSSFCSDPKKGSPGSAGTAPARSGPATQDVAVFPADYDARCCVSPLPRDRPLTTLKGRCGYSMTVVHFRKVVIRKKIGSAGNGHPVIYLCGCMPAYYQHENDIGCVKSLFMTVRCVIKLWFRNGTIRKEYLCVLRVIRMRNTFIRQNVFMTIW